MSKRQDKIILALLEHQRVLLDRQEDLMDRLQEMVGTIHSHQVRQYGLPADTGPFPADSKSLYTSEDHADLQHMQEAGFIPADELKAALAEMDFLNSEIEVG